jgi:hypothetical protein
MQLARVDAAAARKLLDDAVGFVRTAVGDNE